MYNRSELKRSAKERISASETSPYLVMIVYMLFFAVIGMLIYNLGPKIDIKGLIAAANDPSKAEAYLRATAATQAAVPARNYFIMIALSLVSMPFSTGLIVFFMLVWRRLPNCIGNLFDGFAIIFRIIWLGILSGIMIMLWSLLLYFPGIIAAYRYRLAPYLLIDNPHMSALDCIRESKRLMKGHKWELFVLDLSFILWQLLTAIPFVSIYTTPYFQTTYAGYYDIRRAEDGKPWSGTLSPDNNRKGPPPWDYN
ncbi:MAG: DUF975 family protein [Ruminococcaceae bacterium]|nr:DUF975 family protein [Oscillospiraceae bacterium]